MAKIGYVIVCEEVFNDNGDAIIKKPYNVITPYSIPGNFSLVLAFSMFDLETNIQYKLNIEIIQPDNTTLIEQIMDFDFSPPPEQISNSLASGGINLKFNNILFKQEGMHTFKITINGQSFNEIMIPVYPSGQ
ncbi:DUF6941 family protein [Cytobacillus horneckiae]|uniref:DUF6941 family protein n=1 Tax=Cytobacillus horneckiae TaxID=549687 RepID=UPI003D9A9182